MEIPKPNITLPGRKLNIRRLIIMSFAIIGLILAATFFTKSSWTAFIVKEDKPVCTDDCTFEGKTCENAKIFECAAGEDGCKHKSLVEPCPENAVCSTLKEGECYTPQTCDFDFHTCISDVLYKICENGKTIEGAETKKCPDGLMCNRSPKQFALCVEKDY
ncbi:MAG: hypothetical protein Q8N77_06195 [Nanoarchaeota archaeon]|nr:hypothetical protein [Nanoarchaeota archaeon]